MADFKRPLIDTEKVIMNSGLEASGVISKLHSELIKLDMAGKSNYMHKWGEKGAR